MNLDTIVRQLKDNVAALAGRVAGAADFATGLESTHALPMPAAFVLRLQDDAGSNEDWPGLRQDVTERVGIVVQFDNTKKTAADRRTGFGGVDQVDAMRALLFSAVLNWMPADYDGRAARGFQYAGGRLLEFDRARLFWQFEFEILTLITDADGYVEAAPDLELTTDIYPAAM